MKEFHLKNHKLKKYRNQELAPAFGLCAALACQANVTFFGTSCSSYKHDMNSSSHTCTTLQQYGFFIRKGLMGAA